MYVGAAHEVSALGGRCQQATTARSRQASRPDVVSATNYRGPRLRVRAETSTP